MAYRLLIVEDEPRMREIITDYFGVKGFVVTGAENGVEALERLEEEAFDIVLLDVMMPALDGFSVCRRIRKTSGVPVIFLTARSDEDDKLFGYELGADDYVTKPFSLAVLCAKSLSLVRRAKGRVCGDVLSLGGVVLDYQTRRVTANAEACILAPKEFELLAALMENRGAVLTREQLLMKVWGFDYFGNDRVVDNHIKKLRAALGSCAGCVKTVVKVGYSFDVGKEAQP